MIDALQSTAPKIEEFVGLSKAERKRREAVDTAQQFEQILVQSLVTELRQSGGAEKMFGSGPGSDTYAQWFDQVMAERLSDGGSFGIADSVLRDLERHGELGYGESFRKRALDPDAQHPIRRSEGVLV